jgi:hypothetical protein
MSELDRISYAMGIKVNLGNYESADVHISFSTDVKSGETKEQALKRAAKFVENEIDKKHDELKG